MPKFRVTVQNRHCDRRLSRGNKAGGASYVMVTAAGLGEATSQVLNSTDGRVVCVEEIFSDFPEYTDEQLTELLTTAAEEDGIDKEEWEEQYAGKDLVLQDDFETYIVGGVVQALAAVACPGLSYSPVMDDDRTTDYVMVEVWDEATLSYRSRGLTSKYLRDYKTTGWEAVLSVARNLLNMVELHRLA